jgi:hypothetical protein
LNIGRNHTIEAQQGSRTPLLSDWQATGNGFPGTWGETRPRLEKEGIMDFSNMTITDWIIRAAIFGVLAVAVLGLLQNLAGAMKK